LPDKLYRFFVTFGCHTEDAEVAHFGDFEGGKFGAYFIKGGKVGALPKWPFSILLMLVCASRVLMLR
jgi:hypothetical protein